MNWILIVIFSAAISGTSYSKPPDDNAPNVLFILADDLRPQIKAFGPPFSSAPMITPNLDRLASESIVFKRTYCQLSLCSPSRSSFLTGRRPDTTRVHMMGTYFRDVGGNFTTIPQYFKNNGYHSVGMGKIFHPGNLTGNDDPISWSEPYYHAPNEIKYPDDTPLDKIWRTVNRTTLEVDPLEDMHMIDYASKKLAELAPKAKSGKQPFFMAVGFRKPHLPWAFPEEFLDLYPLENISIADNPYAPQNMPWLAWNYWKEIRFFKDIRDLGVSGEVNDTMPIYAAKVLRRAYYSTVSYMDFLVGKLLGELEKQGLSSNTIVTFAGDHGWHLGENGEWAKRTNFELDTLVPMMMRIPGHTDGGIVTNGLVELVDLYPSLVEAAGLPPIPICPSESSDIKVCTEGTSFLPLIKEPARNWKNAAFSQIPRVLITVMGYTIRTDRYRYTEWVEFDEEPDWDDVHARELYDYTKEPQESRNVAEDADYENIRKALSKRLHAGWRKAVPKTKEHMEIDEMMLEHDLV